MAVCDRCGAVGYGATCSLCGAAMPEPSAATVSSSAVPAPSPQVDPYAYGPYQQPYPAAPQRRGAGARLIPALAGVTVGTVALGIVLWQAPGLLMLPKPGAQQSGGSSVVTITNASTSTPASPAVTPSLTPVSDAAAGPLWGTYSGLGRQAGPSSARVWAVSMVFSGETATITYADTGTKGTTCAGQLTRRADGTWIEHITKGGCDDAGLWSFGGSNPLHGAYTPPGGGYGLTGDFARES